MSRKKVCWAMLRIFIHVNFPKFLVFSKLLWITCPGIDFSEELCGMCSQYSPVVERKHRSPVAIESELMRTVVQSITHFERKDLSNTRANTGLHCIAVQCSVGIEHNRESSRE